MDFNEFIKFIKTRYDIDLLNYKESRILKRTNLFMLRKSIADYGRLMSYLSKRENFEEFLQFQRIKISYFLRDRQLFENLINHLCESKDSFMSFLKAGVLSIGCARGEEVYSLVFLLLHKRMQIPGRITGIDSDADLLDCARRGLWNRNSVQNFDDFLKGFLYEDCKNNNVYMVKNKPSCNINFVRFDIMKNDIDVLLPKYGLIMCRNFIIYLSEDFREKFLEKISKLIKKHGLLFLGSTEFIYNPADLGLEYIGHSIYRKVI